MEQIINQLGTNNLDVESNKVDIPLNAIGKILHIKQKPQINAVGKALGIKHAFAVIELESNQGFGIFGSKQQYFLLCDYGLSTQLVSISQQDAQKGETLKSIQIKKNISFQQILDISNNFQVENGDYKLLENNCSHFVKYLQTNLQANNESTHEMDKFTDKQIEQGVKTGVKVAATIGGLLYSGYKILQEANKEVQEQQKIKYQQQQRQRSLNNIQSQQQQNNYREQKYQQQQLQQQNSQQYQNQQLYQGYQQFNQNQQQNNTQNFDYDAYQQSLLSSDNNNQQNQNQNNMRGTQNNQGQSQYHNYY